MRPLCMRHLNCILDTRYKLLSKRSCAELCGRSFLAFRNGRSACCRAESTASPAKQQVQEEALLPRPSATPAPAFKASLDFRFIRDNLDAVRQNVKERNSSADPDRVVRLYEEWRLLEDESGRLRSERNQNSKSMKGKLEPQRRSELIEQGKILKEKVAELDARLLAVENALQVEGQKLPNLSHPQVPRGGEEAAATLRTFGHPPDHAFPIRDHLDLGTHLGLLDFEVAAKGFMPASTPDLVRSAVLEKCGFQPRGENTQVYSIEGSPLCLTGTAEVPLGGMFMDQIIPEEQLPIKLAGMGHCFRTEAGAAGSASRGLYRVHQFTKVEMFVLCTPQQSDLLLDELIHVEEDMFAQLGLHFKTLDMPTGDLGAPAFRKLDVEAWMPGLQRFGEISSASNCTDYQSRRLNIRYRPSSSGDASDSATNPRSSKLPTEFVHTLNATACAVPRMVVAILENFQQADGSVTIPTPLQQYMGGMDTIRAPNSMSSIQEPPDGL